ncbi:MAG: hypothetical protein QXP01_00225 [Candidatus Hadarchaeum sp.]
MTILAWRKGWRWRVLLPWGVAVVSAILLGAGVAASGGEAEDVRGLAVLLELGMLGALVFMACRAPGSAPKASAIAGEITARDPRALPYDHGGEHLAEDTAEARGSMAGSR